MSLEKYKKYIEEFESDEIKSKYIKSFIDCNKPWYEKYIIIKRKYSDGEYYHGYLWDCINDNYKLITLKDIFAYEDFLDEVNVFWDLHSAYHQRDRSRYWNFGRNSILRIKYSVLMNILDYLPEDIYIFDDTYQWTFILTHEDIEGKPMIFKIGEIQSRE